MTTDNGLDLSTVAPEREPVRLRSGVSYRMSNHDDLTLTQLARFRKLMSLMAPLETKDEPTEQDDADYVEYLRELVLIVLVDCPNTEVHRLTRGDLNRVARYFLAGMPTAVQGMGNRAAEAMREGLRNGPSTSPGSSDSTGEPGSNT